MNTINYVLFYLIVNILYVYTIFRFMGVFFEREKIKRKEVFSYFIFYIVISFIFLVFNIPLLSLITNIISFFLLSLNYKSNFKKKVISIFFIISIMMFSEIIVTLFMVNIDLSIFKSIYLDISIIIFSRIISYLIVLIFEGAKNVKNNIELPNIYWFSVFFIPLSSMYLTLLLFQNSNLNKYELLISILILFIINIVTFYLYDMLTRIYKEKIQNELLEKQNQYYEEQFKIMNSSYKKLKAIRHDLKNHLIAIEDYIIHNKKEKVLKYIEKINTSSYDKREFAHSGNVDIDSILNYKIQYAKSKGISIDLNLNIPYDLNLDSFDMIIVIGNLIDNAIEATFKLENDKRFIHINIFYDRNILHMHFKNNFDGKIIKEKEKILTTKKDKFNHGIGLKNVKYILNKYEGDLDCSYDDNIFYVKLLFYL
ncbi:ATP-binding protein [Senegalia massiliensis]|uniref:ATP-binding protein n=2 Tax=Senegalia massiliensis TaxID=1720316 RepID=A0A845QWD8_9CLOT|nr:ATP-binding protein [Senegalia massiliensis]